MSYDPSDPGESPDCEDYPTLDDFGDAIDDLNDCEKLSDWELEFVDSMLQRRESDPHTWAERLSDKQCACVVSMWRKRCG